MNDDPLTASEKPAARERRDPLTSVGRIVLDDLQVFGEGALLFFRALARLRPRRRQLARIMDQVLRVGVQTVPLTFLVSLFVGMVMVVQSADQLERFTQEILGSIVGLAMTKEMGPVVMAFLLAGRAGSAVAAELGSMRVNDEIHALRMMDIDPVEFLVVPRFVAMTLALPVLVLYADIVGIAGGALVVAVDPAIHITVRQYFSNLFEWVTVSDIAVGVVKALVFGMVISVISCTFGLRTRGGSEGVARSTTSAVVWSFVLVIVFDYLIVRAALVLL